MAGVVTEAEEETAAVVVGTELSLRNSARFTTVPADHSDNAEERLELTGWDFIAAGTNCILSCQSWNPVFNGFTLTVSA